MDKHVTKHITHTKYTW